MSKGKVVLAFSGGLDTSFCLAWLIEQGYEVVTVLVDTGGLDANRIKAIEERARSLGTRKHYTVNAESDIYTRIIQYVIRFNALYEGDYPLMCADRYVIAEAMIDVAKKENATFVSHGSTGAGNDQVRFDASLMTLASDITILTPVRQLGITREDEIKWLQARNISVDNTMRRYSVNQNVFGITVSGSEIDQGLPPHDDAWVMTRCEVDQSSTETLKIGFKDGVPVTLDGKTLAGLDILKTLNERVGRYGIGRQIYVGDCIIGVKGRIAFEAPGLFTLIEAHRKLEQICLTARQMRFEHQASESWTELVYSGLYYEPLARNLEALATSVQTQVNGEATIRLSPGNFQVVSVNSDQSLIRPEVAMYAQTATWTGEEACGFIRMHAMQQFLAAAASRKKS